MNKFFGIGRLTRDVDVTYTQSGKAVSKFTIAIDSGYGDKKQTDFINITCFDKLAEVAGNNIGKGRKILVEGRLQIREYQDKEGQKRRSTEILAQNIEFLDSKKETIGEQMGSNMAGGYDVTSMGKEVFNDEELCF